MTLVTKRIGLFVGGAILALGLGSAYVAAQNTSGRPGPFMGRGGPGGPMGMMAPLGRLNLTDAQRQQVKSIMDSHQDEVKAVGSRAFEARKALDAAVTADTFDESAIRTASANVATVDADMAVLRARIHGEVWQILTPDQQKQAKEFQTRMQQRPERSGRRAR
jgi:protein CpxP